VKTSQTEAIWHDIECGAYRADLPLWRKLASAATRRTDSPCELLEIGCGTGRVSLALAGDRCRVTAVDIEPELVEVLQQRAAEKRVQVDGIVADARSLELDASFDVVLAPMQVAQLLGAADRVRMLTAIKRHLRPEGVAAVALLDLDEEWDESSGPLPPPDKLERDGWAYASQPVAVHRLEDEEALGLDTIRRITSPDGEQTETFSRIQLEILSPPQLETEARKAGLVPRGRRSVPATKDHVASTVVTLGHRGAPSPDG
jgi:SAM-dependent methyltransferase